MWPRRHSCHQDTFMPFLRHTQTLSFTRWVIMANAFCQWNIITAPQDIHDSTSPGSELWREVLRAAWTRDECVGYERTHWSRVFEDPETLWIWTGTIRLYIFTLQLLLQRSHFRRLCSTFPLHHRSRLPLNETTDGRTQELLYSTVGPASLWPMFLAISQMINGPRSVVSEECVRFTTDQKIVQSIIELLGDF
ncbi:hypothetical protein BDV95DRAFT_73836 [Massariosphaeria phaeospora]|uniref:Uncharacterized protein n=1 Tax=Massariosphaeria phaeospora TaxID=100035 RepID=A0A7C8MA13_9PLEO|nr:hypothetical protein BDV95DRAFT_73836 [Massariosphaeria phaeospora]